jgi:hypothetical protein
VVQWWIGSHAHIEVADIWANEFGVGWRWMLQLLPSLQSLQSALNTPDYFFAADLG